MPEKTNNTQINLSSDIDDARPSAIKIENVSMVFNMASEQLNNLKEYFLAIVKHKLFFEEFRALNDISLDVKKGDVFGIVGTNGSGKSTLLKIVAGVLEPTEGKVTIDGSIAPLIELGAGFDIELTARENIYLNGALLGYSKSFIDENFEEIVDFSEVRQFLDMPMKNFSSGMIARIAFAIATVIVPDILIVDEVLAVGDFMFQRKCEERIMGLIKNHNTTVLIVSHSNAQIKRLCNKAIWIEKGRKRMIGDAQTVCDIYGLIGGRTGSTDSENKILKLHEATKSVNPNTTYQVNGASYQEITLQTIKHTNIKNFDTVCFACIDDERNFAQDHLASPVLTISEDRVDFHLVDWLEEVKPATIKIYNCNNKPGPDDLAHYQFSWNPTIEVVGSNEAKPAEKTDSTSASQETEAGTTDEAIVLPKNPRAFAYSAASQYYAKQTGASVIFVDDTNLDSIVEALTFIEDHKISKLAIVNGPDALSESTCDLLSRTAAQNS